MVDYDKREVIELINQPHWWSDSYKERNDIQVYDLSIIAESTCDDAKNLKSFQILTSPSDISSKNALGFNGKIIENMIQKTQPFLIFVPDPEPNVFRYPTQQSACQIHQGHPCLLIINPLVNKSNIKQTDNIKSSNVSEILSVNEIVWTSEKKPIWYLAVPFSFALDITIAGTLLLFLGLAGGAGAR